MIEPRDFVHIRREDREPLPAIVLDSDELRRLLMRDVNTGETGPMIVPDEKGDPVLHVEVERVIFAVPLDGAPDQFIAQMTERGFGLALPVAALGDEGQFMEFAPFRFLSQAGGFG